MCVWLKFSVIRILLTFFFALNVIVGAINPFLEARYE